MNRRHLILLILVMTALSCGSRSKPPEGILPEQKMVDLLVETHLTDAILYSDNSMAEAKRDKALSYYPSVLEKFRIEKAQMDSSVAWYMRHPKAFARVYEKVILNLEKRQAAESKNVKTEE